MRPHPQHPHLKMDNHQALVASTWDADQVALRDLVEGIVNINN